jgi:hypothetical protein
MATTPRKTFPELQALSAPLVDSDVLAVYRSPGPAKRTTASVLGTYVGTVIGTAFTRSLLATANQAAFLAAFGQIDVVETDFAQSGTGAVVVTGQAKLRQAPIQPNSGEFGAFTNATVTTATLLAAFTAAMANGRAVELAGHYDINGPITPVSAVDGAELNIILRDDVTITVDAGATAFYRVFYAESTTAKNHSIDGLGSLTLNCNNKAAVGVWLRHTAASSGGTVTLNAPVYIKNVKSATGIDTAAGIVVLGRYERVIMRSPTVEDVTRTDAAGECSGIFVSGFDGEVELYSPVVRRVYYGPGTGDADCIKCFGRGSGYARREGSVRIYSPVLEDGQVRLYKDQCGNTIIYGPFCRRRGVDGTAGSFAASDSIDFDFQYGGGLVLDAYIEYFKSATNVTPLGSSHSVSVFQQVIDDLPMYAAIRNSTVVSDVVIPRYALHVTRAGALASTTEIDGLTMVPANGFATSMIARAVLEFSAAEIKASSTKSTFNVRNTSVPNTLYLVAYTNGDGTDISAKIGLHISNNETTLAPISSTVVLGSLSGTVIPKFTDYSLAGNNRNYISAFANWNLNFNTIKAGNDFFVVLSSVVVTGGPSGLPTSGIARIQTGGGERDWLGWMPRTITVDDGLVAFYKADAGWNFTGLPALPGVTTVGDADATLTARTSAGNQNWSTTLTADRAVTLSTTGALTGDVFRISRPASGAFNLNVGSGPLKALAAGTWCEVTYNGSAWVLTAAGTL